MHTIQRCVRRAFLAGVDPQTGKDYGFRREWIRCRMEALASVFGVDVLTYAVLSNHLHLILRNRPPPADRDAIHAAATRGKQGAMPAGIANFRPGPFKAFGPFKALVRLKLLSALLLPQLITSPESPQVAS